jgi:dihydroorotate dehydrogenase
LIATNTTVDYDLIPGAERSGGLSGAVLRERSFTLLQALAGALAGRCVLISVGGVDSAREAYRRLRAGASLVQLYSALIYEGPGLAGRINRGLLRLLEDDGLSDITAAIGADL